MNFWSYVCLIAMYRGSNVDTEIYAVKAPGQIAAASGGIELYAVPRAEAVPQAVAVHCVPEHAAVVVSSNEHGVLGAHDTPCVVRPANPANPAPTTNQNLRGTSETGGQICCYGCCECCFGNNNDNGGCCTLMFGSYQFGPYYGTDGEAQYGWHEQPGIYQVATNQQNPNNGSVGNCDCGSCGNCCPGPCPSIDCQFCNNCGNGCAGACQGIDSDTLECLGNAAQGVGQAAVCICQAAGCILQCLGSAE